VTGALDLHVADIDTGHPVTGRDQVAGNRDAKTVLSSRIRPHYF